MEAQIIDLKIESLEKEIIELRRIKGDIDYEERCPTPEKKWYNIDTGTHHVVSQGLLFESQLFCVESNHLNTFKKYYVDNFGIEYVMESKLEDILRKTEGDNNFKLLDPSLKYHSVPVPNIKRFLFRNMKHRIVCNNKLLFNAVIEMLNLKAKHTRREKIDWFNTEIKRYLNFQPPIRGSDGVMTCQISGMEVFYSRIHMLWGFNRSEFDYVYQCETGHLPQQEELLIKRLKKQKRNYYVNLDSNILKPDQVAKESTVNFKFVDHNLRLVANSKTVFESYRRLLN